MFYHEQFLKIYDKELPKKETKMQINQSSFKGAYWKSSNIAIAILDFFSISPPAVIALPTLR